jgi:selenocysteine-specific elongation factor
VIAMRGDRYILRRPSPSETLGGGIVLDPNPPYRHKRFDQDVLDHLETLSAGDPVDVMRQIISRAGVANWNDVIEQSGLEVNTARESLAQLLEEGLVLVLGDGSAGNEFVAQRATWDEIKSKLVIKVEGYHQEYPLRPGMSREELKSQSGLADAIFKQAIETLIQEGELIKQGPAVLLQGFSIEFSPGQTEKINSLLEKFSQNPILPPSVNECREEVGEEVYTALLSLKKLEQISPEVVFTPETYQKMIVEIKEKLQDEGTITVAQARVHFGSSRKYILAFLEKLDAKGVTIREGDIRRLKE